MLEVLEEDVGRSGCAMSETTSLELSKQLKEAGAKQESERFYSLSSDSAFRLEGWPPGFRPEGWIAAFDCAELLKGLPSTIEIDGWDCILIIWVCEDCYQVGYYEQDYEGPYIRSEEPIEKELHEALGKLKLWCLQEGHCDN